MVLQGKSSTVAAQARTELGFDQVFCLLAAFVFGKGKAYAFGAVGRGARRIDPNDFGWQEAFWDSRRFLRLREVFA